MNSNSSYITRMLDSVDSLDSGIGKAKAEVKELYDLCWEGDGADAKEVVPESVMKKVLNLMATLDSL